MKITLAHNSRGYIHIVADGMQHRYKKNGKGHFIYEDSGHDPLGSYDLKQKTAILEALRLAGEGSRMNKAITIEF